MTTPRKPSLQGKYLRRDGRWVRWRSTFELQLMLELDAAGRVWEYEPFKACVGPGPKCVIPDFFLPEENLVIDVKGTNYLLNKEAVRKIEATRQWCYRMKFRYEVRNDFTSLSADRLTDLRSGGKVTFTTESAKRIAKRRTKR